MTRFLTCARYGVAVIFLAAALWPAVLRAQNKPPVPAGGDQRMQQELQRLKKGVEQRLGREEKGFFVIALSQTIYEPMPPQPQGGGGGAYGGGGGAYGGGGGRPRMVPKTSVEVEKIEGRAAAAEAIVKHMTEQAPPAGPNAQREKRDWRFVGRYETDKQAGEIAQQAKQRFQTPQGPGPGRPGQFPGQPRGR